MMWGRPPGLRGSSRTRLRRAQARPRACDNRRSSRMPKVFPCYSTPDRELVYELAAFLERGAGVEVLLEEGEMQPGGDLIAKVEEGLSADVVLVLLSPEAVPPRWVLERWKSGDSGAAGNCPLAAVLSMTRRANSDRQRDP